LSLFDLNYTQNCLQSSQECDPGKIKNLTATLYYDKNNDTFDLKVSWNQPKIEPEFYSLIVTDVDDNLRNNSKPSHLYEKIISGVSCLNFFINLNL
jgi:hypothetical protein